MRHLGWKLIKIGLGMVLPHPTYGNHVGFSNDTELPPVDAFDACAERHDDRLCDAWIEYGSAVTDWVKDVEHANSMLHNEAKQARAKTLWGEVIRRATVLIFRA